MAPGPDAARNPPTWDFFVAHAREDLPAAAKLFELLSPAARVFLDAHSIQLGDDWDITLAIAQRSSRVTVVLVSAHVNQVYYQREEIAAAIALARSNPDSHRVVPIFLSEEACHGHRIRVPRCRCGSCGATA